MRGPLARIPKPGAAIAADAAARFAAAAYRSDFADGFAAPRAPILAASVYIFLASALPAIAFGQQLADSTDGALTVAHVLVSTAAAGVAQALIGGQPLLIVGVAEPIVLIYGFMYAYARSAPGLGPELFLPWAAWVCVWTAALCAAAAAANLCRLVGAFTRFSGEIFGTLIAVLFVQVGVKGLIDEFKAAPAVAVAGTLAVTEAEQGAAAAATAAALTGRVNGLFALILAAFLVLSARAAMRARGWVYLRWWLRALLADYGAALAFAAATALSFALRGVPGAPRRVAAPDVWALPPASWAVAARMHLVPPSAIAAALAPAAAIAVLFYFDHNVSSLMAQQPEFGLTKPAAYSWDFLLLAALTLLCGLLGLPPVNGVLPQAPMHTRALATLVKRDSGGGGAQQQKQQQQPQFTVREQRVSGLLQSLLCAACVGLTPALRYVPTAVLWGFFVFMALESLPGNQLWERTVLVAFADPRRRYVLLEAPHAAYLQTVPLRAVARFTLLQLVLLAGVWALTTFGGAAAFLFPLPIMALVPLRRYALPRVFARAQLEQLDASEYEEAPPLAPVDAVLEAAADGLVAPDVDPATAAAQDAAAADAAAAYHGISAVHRLSAEEVRQRQRQQQQQQQQQASSNGEHGSGAGEGGGGGGAEANGGGRSSTRHSHEF